MTITIFVYLTKLFEFVPVDLVNLLKFNLTRMGRFLGLQSEHISLKGHEFARSLTQRETIIAFTCFVQHHQRWLLN